MKDFFRNNGLLVLLAAVLLALVTWAVSLLLGGTANPAANLLGVITTPVRSGLNAVISWAEGRYSAAFEQEKQASELEELRKQVSEMEADLRRAQTALEENKRYRSLLNLREGRESYELESAYVTARTSSNWASTLTISKGSSAGVESGDCVVDQYWNLVGVVSEVGLNWAELTTVVDTDMEMGGLISRTGGAAILEGDFSLMREGRLKLSYLPEGCELRENDVVLTSGRGGVYPPNLPVGHVEEVRTDPSGMTRYAVLIPQSDLDGLSQVFVIKSFDIVE